MIAADVLHQIHSDLYDAGRGRAVVIALGAHKRCLTGNGDGTAQVCHKDECAVQNADQQQRLSLILPADLCAHFPDFRLDLFLCDEDTLDLLFKFLGCHR